MQQISQQPQQQQQQQYQDPLQQAVIQTPQSTTPIPPKPDEGSYYTLPYGYHSSSLPLTTETADTVTPSQTIINSNVTAFYTNNLNNCYSTASNSANQNQNMTYMQSKSNIATSTTGSQSGKFVKMSFIHSFISLTCSNFI